MTENSCPERRRQDKFDILSTGAGQKGTLGKLWVPIFDDVTDAILLPLGGIHSKTVGFGGLAVVRSLVRSLVNLEASVQRWCQDF